MLLLINNLHGKRITERRRTIFTGHTTRNLHLYDNFALVLREKCTNF